jgi:hypothetical protein
MILYAARGRYKKKYFDGCEIVLTSNIGYLINKIQEKYLSPPVPRRGHELDKSG